MGYTQLQFGTAACTTDAVTPKDLYQQIPATTLRGERLDMGFEPRTYMLGFTDLCRTTDRLGDSLPDGLKVSEERDFGQFDSLVERLVRRCQQEGDVVDAEQRTYMEDKAMRDRRRWVPNRNTVPASVRCVQITAILDPVGSIESVERVLTTVRTGVSCSDGLESPLNVTVELLRTRLYCAELDKAF